MNREFELIKEIEQLEKLHEKNKNKRTTKAMAVVAVVFYVVNIFWFGINEPRDYLINIPAALFETFIYFVFSAIIFGALNEKSGQEKDYINFLKRELEVIRRENLNKQRNEL